jgi:peptide deformylase
MAVREIIQLGDQLLWNKSETVTGDLFTELESLITDMSDTLVDFKRKRGFGRAIAAPQIGVLKKVIYIQMPDRKLNGAMINPEIIEKGDNTIELWDNCLSFPDLVVKVRRFEKIKVQYKDVSGREQILEASGELSELLQHEIDHLDGILAVDRTDSSKDFMTLLHWNRFEKRVSNKTLV